MTINKQALREVAEKATPGPWYVHDKPCEDGNYGIDTSDKEFLAEAVVWWGFARQSIWREEDAKFIAAANPATVLALLDENIQLQRGKDAMEAVALALRDDMRDAREQLEEAEKQVEELTMWVKRLAHSLRNAKPNSKLHGAAMDYLSRKGLISVEDVLR